ATILSSHRKALQELAGPNNDVASLDNGLPCSLHRIVGYVAPLGIFGRIDDADRTDTHCVAKRVGLLDRFRHRRQSDLVVATSHDEDDTVTGAPRNEALNIRKR